MREVALLLVAVVAGPALDVLQPVYRVREAEDGEIQGVPIRVVRADHLAAIALAAGRPKDYARILALLESGAVTVARLEELASRHGLSAEWQRFRSKFLE